MDEINYISLLDRFMRGETSPEEENLLLQWFRTTEAKNEIGEFYRHRWEESAGMEMSQEQQERILSQLRTRIQVTDKKQTVKKLYFLDRWLPYAAAILLCLGVGLTSYYFTRNAFDRDYKEYRVSADKGQRSTVTLPDGTVVWLNSHTEVIYSNEYGAKDRVVSLTGEAYFEVAKDKEQRFIVKAGEMEIEALGTSFNVKAYKEDKEIITTLFEGKVKATAEEDEAILYPNHFAAFDREEHKLIYGVDENAFYARMWRENELAFDRNTLEEIAILLNRMYSVHIEFESEKIKQYHFSGVIKNNSLDNVIEIISLTAPITYDSLGDTIRISGKVVNKK